jgi:hypothetical protein
VNEVVYCPPNADCPCYAKFCEEITELRSALLNVMSMLEITLELAEEAYTETELLREALDDLLTEAEDVFVCMADSTGIDRMNYPQPFLAARALLGDNDD